MTALGVRLAGHATEIDDLLRNHWHDWYQSVLDGYHLLCGCCDDVVVIGLSMGAVLSLRLAAELPVRGVVTMSAPSILHFNQLDWRAQYARLISPIMRVVPKEYDGEPPPDVYTAFPTLAIAQFFDLIKATDPLLPKVTVPSLIVHSRADDFIKPDNANYYNLRLVNSPHEVFWLDRSEHVVTILFAEQEGRTTLTEHVLYASPEHRDGHLQSGMEAGMQETFERLNEALASMARV